MQHLKRKVQLAYAINKEASLLDHFNLLTRHKIGTMQKYKMETL
jgi:hypothetical protein